MQNWETCGVIMYYLQFKEELKTKVKLFPDYERLSALENIKKIILN